MGLLKVFPDADKPGLILSCRSFLVFPCLKFVFYLAVDIWCYRATNSRVSKRSMIAESQRELLQAREMIDEAQRTLTSSLEDRSFWNTSGGEDIDKDSERLESVKAAAISSIIGVLASLPISSYEVHSLPQLFFRSSVVLISCALFGVTFRYAVRRDLDNIQLKTGAAAAFAVVRGLALLESGRTFELSTDALMSLALDGAVSVVGSIFIFLSSAIALDYCFKMGFLSPFPARKQ